METHVEEIADPSIVFGMEVVDLLDGCRVIETLEEGIARRVRLQTDAGGRRLGVRPTRFRTGLMP